MKKVVLLCMFASALVMALFAASIFGGYVGSGCGANPICTITMNMAKAVTVTFTPSSTTVNNYYVNASTGLDSNSGSQSTPWATIQHAVDNYALGAGGAVIHVASGTYSDKHTSADTGSCLSGLGSAIACIARGGASPSARLVLECDHAWSFNSSTGCLLRNNDLNSYGIFVNASNVDIGAVNSFGFDIGNEAGMEYAVWNFCDKPGTPPAACSRGNSVHILGNYVHDSGTTVTAGILPGTVNSFVGCPGVGTIAAGGGHNSSGEWYVTDNQIIGNRVHNVWLKQDGSGNFCNNAHGIYPVSPGVIVYNNIVDNVGATGIHVYDVACSARVSNNTSFENGRNGFVISHGGATCAASGQQLGHNTVNNNIAVNNGVGLGGGFGFEQATSGDDCSSTNPSLFSNNLSNGNASGDNNLGACDNWTAPVSQAAASVFVNWRIDGSGDYHLKVGSLAINGGTTTCVTGGAAPCFPAFDFDGNSRGSTPSIGAYQ